MRKSIHISSSVMRLGAVLMLALWLTTLLASISPAIHNLLHQDSQSAQHDCVVTHVNKGQISSVISTGFLLTAPPVLPASPTQAAVVVVSAADHRLLPSRAPPALAL